VATIKVSLATVTDDALFLPFEDAATDDLVDLPLGAMLCDQLGVGEKANSRKEFCLVEISSLQWLLHRQGLNFGGISHAKSRPATTLHVQPRAYHQSVRCDRTCRL